MVLKTLLLAIAGLQLLSGVLVSADETRSFVVWPGYLLALPPNYCVNIRNGPDFHVLYLRDRQSPQRTILAGVYCGFAPDFHPDCVKPVSRTWKARGLSFQSVRGAQGCAEFLVRDSGNTRRGFLHIWFGPGAKERPEMAETLIASIRPAPMPLTEVPDLPACE